MSPILPLCATLLQWCSSPRLYRPASPGFRLCFVLCLCSKRTRRHSEVPSAPSPNKGLRPRTPQECCSFFPVRRPRRTRWRCMVSRRPVRRESLSQGSTVRPRFTALPSNSQNKVWSRLEPTFHPDAHTLFMRSRPPFRILSRKGEGNIVCC
jgi:hypothetical protein